MRTDLVAINPDKALVLAATGLDQAAELSAAGDAARHLLAEVGEDPTIAIAPLVAAAWLVGASVELVGTVAGVLALPGIGPQVWRAPLPVSADPVLAMRAARDTAAAWLRGDDVRAAALFDAFSEDEVFALELFERLDLQGLYRVLGAAAGQRPRGSVVDDVVRGFARALMLQRSHSDAAVGLGDLLPAQSPHDRLLRLSQLFATGVALDDDFLVDGAELVRADRADGDAQHWPLGDAPNGDDPRALILEAIATSEEASRRVVGRPGGDALSLLLSNPNPFDTDRYDRSVALVLRSAATDAEAARAIIEWIGAHPLVDMPIADVLGVIARPYLSAFITDEPGSPFVVDHVTARGFFEAVALSSTSTELLRGGLAARVAAAPATALYESAYAAGLLERAHLDERLRIAVDQDAAAERARTFWTLVASIPGGLVSKPLLSVAATVLPYGAALRFPTTHRQLSRLRAERGDETELKLALVLLTLGHDSRVPAEVLDVDHPGAIVNPLDMDEAQVRSLDAWISGLGRDDGPTGATYNELNSGFGDGFDSRSLTGP